MSEPAAQERLVELVFPDNTPLHGSPEIWGRLATDVAAMVRTETRSIVRIVVRRGAEVVFMTERQTVGAS